MELIVTIDDFKEGIGSIPNVNEQWVKVKVNSTIDYFEPVYSRRILSKMFNLSYVEDYISLYDNLSDEQKEIFKQALILFINYEWHMVSKYPSTDIGYAQTNSDTGTQPNGKQANLMRYNNGVREANRLIQSLCNKFELKTYFRM